MTTDKNHLLGFDIGGTKCAVVLARIENGDISILGRRSFATALLDTPEQVLECMEKEADGLISEHNLSREDIRSAGISCGGPLDSKRGVILGPPNLPGWDYVPVVDHIASAMGVPTRLQNDANAGALAEWRFGAGKGTRNMIFMTFGTGLGAGLILDGKLYSGTNDLAGEVGHTRLADNGPLGYGKHGSFEGFCSGGGIARNAQEKIRHAMDAGIDVSMYGDISSLSARDVVEAARKGDKIALEVINETGSYLGRGLAMLIDILNPELIVIGSIFTRARDLLWPVAEDIIKSEALSGSVSVCKVVPAALGEKTGDYASIAVALED